MEPIRTFQARTIVLPIENIDTDQIIPARLLKVTSKSGIGSSSTGRKQTAPLC
jgi:3-isopropylmalate/(R)-2-methylmalate dehydratase small subunit